MTGLLVLCTLLDNINNRLPSSPDIRLVDIWNIWFMFQIALLTLLHVACNALLMMKFQFMSPCKLNTAGKIGFPLLNVVFSVYYVLHNQLYQESEFQHITD